MDLLNQENVLLESTPLLRELRKTIRTGSVSVNQRLSEMTNLKVDGVAPVFVIPGNEYELVTSIGYLRDIGVPYLLVGETTNMLFNDQGINAVLIKVGRGCSDISVQPNRMSVQADACAPYVTRSAYRYGLTGIDHTAGILL